MSNTPCAYAVDSVLHRRVEIKVESSRPKTNGSLVRWLRKINRATSCQARYLGQMAL
jgi:hypothetical protein